MSGRPAGEHKIAALMGIEGGHAIEDDLRLLRRFYDLGVRYMTLTHFNSNHWADASGDPKEPNHGLSPFGKDVVQEMNRLGMMVAFRILPTRPSGQRLKPAKRPLLPRIPHAARFRTCRETCRTK